MAPDLKFLVEIHHYEKRNTFNPLATAGFRLESSNRVSAQGSGRQTPNEPFLHKSVLQNILNTQYERK